MAIVTAQLLTKYYDLYRNTEVTLTKDIIRALSIDPRQIYIKCAGSQWPCIINSTSFTQGKILVGIKGGAFQQLAQKDPPPVSLRLSFYQSDGQLGSFFITGKVNGFTRVEGGKDLMLITIQYTQRPPDDFIEMIGHMLDANANAAAHKDERIMITPDTIRKLGLKEEFGIAIQNVPRHCVVRDLSFGGAKAVLQGIPQYLTNKDVILTLSFEEPQEKVNIKGVISAIAPIEGRKDLVSADITFEEASIPLSYKVHINTYLSSILKNERENQAKAEKDAVKEAIKAQEKAARQQAKATGAPMPAPSN